MVFIFVFSCQLVLEELDGLASRAFAEGDADWRDVPQCSWSIGVCSLQINKIWFMN